MSRFRIVCACALLWFSATGIRAQEAPPATAEAPPELPTIADDPKTIDPADFVPDQLTTEATVDFSNSSLREVLTWLRDQQNLVILLDDDALSDTGVLPGDPISDRLEAAPIYLLLNRLRSLDLSWYFEDDVLHVTSAEVAAERLTTIPYSIGDLLDAGYELDALEEVVVSAVSPESWGELGGLGAVNYLGDVMFIRQTHRRHREVRGLLAALRTHGRRTFTLDPPQHAVLHEKLGENVTVALEDTPLESAIRELAEKTQADIRLDIPALQAAGVRPRRPITLSLVDRKLKTVLQAMLIQHGLTWIVRDGAIWVTTLEEAEEFLKTAVYDVRDLCRDADESDALHEALVSQTDPASWDELGGPGSIGFVRPGTLVVSNTERALDEVLDLLETYRTALRSSKPRQRDEDDPNQVVTIYYRMHAKVAEDLASLLPQFVRPDSWKSEKQPEAPGELFFVSSAPELSKVPSVVVTTSGGNLPTQPWVLERAVLIIRQTRAAHDEIKQIIHRVESGDARRTSGGGGFGGGGGGRGGGGFGGGIISNP